MNITYNQEEKIIIVRNGDQVLTLPIEEAKNLVKDLQYHITNANIKNNLEEDWNYYGGL